ncbi:hypothetical protein HanRHA438_Chr15g0713341 [Helianthus annuus]|uniref:DUF241 domain protein n=1 Tax=Helianthus annuus TaxID=4232 RepID=A0A251S9B4_HELAN|nr:uncharacterized protein LOC118487277 [Helianthus annuus]KAF5765212.1 hypothetical protein HanXRQr2_Chr15g0701111 [Helianthus annuus]KAJ0451775.1 hypothetical protein HanHA300_Chr15g0571411 [Helianthus annuus]KAJ0456436.1 hypothetical protein HanIR_Chr15g0762461 [Helianthus annuus]KAJ0473661.1 hypothetical protein HanHA89_Chr15g0620881 [Helianthus annuus]KAJ0649238.1 hypothetical protein HanLR1_Chr15g0581981 [Helianthus annuus]
MEGSSSTSTSTSHFRSISLPSRLTHPSHNLIETKTNELKAWGDLVCSSQTIQNGLVGLVELYVCVDELFRSPHTQQALSRHQCRTLVEDALEGSIVLLDSCSILKEIIELMKENVQILQSVLRRKASNSTVADQIATFLCFRNKIRKSIIKSLGTLKSIEKKMCLVSFQDVDHHVSMVSKVVGEVNALTISLFKTILVFLSPKSKATNGFQLLSKFVLRSKSTQEKVKVFINEVEAIDMATLSLLKSSHNHEMNDADVQMILKNLQILDVCIDGFDAGLNCLFRKLIQYRASILNMAVC